MGRNLVRRPVQFQHRSGAAYRVDVAPWRFAAAGLGALGIALATVRAHALTVARSKPAAALRYA